MLLYRGALVYAEDANHDDRHGLSPVDIEVLKYVHGAVTPDEVSAARHHLPMAIHDTITVNVVANSGRWLVPCPWCHSASLASSETHRFFCVECRNRGARGKWIRVIWPDLKDEIEALLIMRPDPRTRNWTPPETVADLLAENASHGVI